MPVFGRGFPAQSRLFGPHRPDEITAAADVASATGAAANPSIALALNAENAAAVGAAYTATPSVKPSAETPLRRVPRNDRLDDRRRRHWLRGRHRSSAAADADAQPERRLRKCHGRTNTSASSISGTSGVATRTGAANAPAPSLSPTAGAGAATGAATDSTAALAPTPAVAAASGASSAPDAALAVNAEAASATGAAHDPTVTSRTSTDAPADVAAATAAAHDASASIQPAAGAAAATGQASNPSTIILGGIGFAMASASATTSRRSSTIPDLAAATGAAYDGGPAVFAHPLSPARPLAPRRGWGRQHGRRRCEPTVRPPDPQPACRRVRSRPVPRPPAVR